MKSLVLSLIISLFALMMPFSVLAAPYGEGSYGVGSYNVGEVPPSPTPVTTATPSPNPTPASSPTPEPSSDSNKPDSTSRSSGSSSSPEGCSAQKPSAVPDLFQINAHPDSVTLYFAPVSGNRDRYFVSYSTSENAEEHGYELLNSSDGVIAVDISYLQKFTTYYFKVRAGNGCQPGEWSNILAVRTGQRLPSYRWSSLPRIISTAITSRAKPSSVERIQAENPARETEVEARKPESNPTPTLAPGHKEPTPQPSPQPASLLNRVTNFFKRVFGR